MTDTPSLDLSSLLASEDELCKLLEKLRIQTQQSDKLNALQKRDALLALEEFRKAAKCPEMPKQPDTSEPPVSPPSIPRVSPEKPVAYNALRPLPGR